MSINIGTLDIGVAFAGDTASLQKATADAQQGIDRFGASTSKAMRQVREDTKGAEDALGRLSQGFKGAVIGSSVAVGLIKLKNTAIEVGDALIQAQVQLDKLNNGFKFGAGGAAGGARELAFVREEANRLGLEIGGAATQYMKMVAAARGTNMEGAKTRELFTSIAEASTVMGMSGEQSERAMMAVVQMMSKGKVQAEELRGQLGEHLPGAFSIAARAMGVTEVELNKLMETGQVMSADFLPKFAAQLRGELAGSVDDATKSMQASLNRFETAWLTFKQNVAESGVSDAMGGQINILSDAFNGISERMEAARKAGSGFWGQTAAGAGGVAAFLNPINALSYSAISLQGQLEQAKTKLNELEKQRPYSGNIFLGPAIEETKQLIAELERAKLARDQLARPQGTNASESRYSAMAEADAIKAMQAKGQAYAKLMTDMATPQEKLTAAIFKAKQELGELYGPEVEARLREHFIKPTKQAKEKLDDFTKSAQRGLELYSDLAAGEGGLAKDFSEKWVQLSDAYAKSYISLDQLVLAQAELLKQQPFYKKGLEDEEKALKEQAKATAEAAKAYDAYFDAVEKRTDTLQSSIQSENAAVAALGLSKTAIAELEAAKLEDMATSKEREAITWSSMDLSGEMTAKLRAEAKALRDLAAAKVNRATQETEYDEIKKATEAWQKASEDIEKSLTDALMRGFESGKGFAEVLRDTVANMFKTLVLRPVISAVMNPIAAGITGSLGLAGAANAATGATSSIGMMSTLAGGASAFGLGAQAGFGALLNGGLTEAVTSGITTAFTGGSLGSAMAGLGTVVGALGPIVAVAALIKSLDDSGTYHTGGLGSYSRAGGTAVGDAVKSQGLGFDLNSRDYIASGEKAATQIAQTIVGIIDSTAETFGGKAGAYAATAFADDVSRDGAWGALMVKLGDQMLINWQNGTDKWPGREFANGEAGAKEYAAAVAKDVRDYLITQTPDWADTMLNALGDTPTLEQLGQVVAQINAAANAFETMGRASQAFAGLGETVTSTLIRELGGAESAVSKLDGYYANFYSESERAAISTQKLTEGFADLGLAVPDSREALRGMIDTALAAGDTTLAANLLNLSGAFASLTPAAEDAATAIKDAVAKMKGEAKTLDRELLVATGGDVRAYDTKGFTQEQIDLYDSNAAKRAQIDAAKAAAKAQEDAAKDAAQAAEAAWKDYAAKQKAIADEKAGIERQILEVQGDTAAIRALELAALDESNRPLQQRLWLLQDEQKVTDQAKGLERQILEVQGDTAAIRALELAALEEANRPLQERLWLLEDEKKVTDQRKGLERQLLEAMGDTAAIRALERAELDETNRAIYDQINAIKDEKTAKEKAAEAAKKAAEAAEEAAKKFAASMQSLLSTADSNAAKFLNPAALSSYQYSRAASDLSVLLPSSTISATLLQSLGIKDIQDAVLYFVQTDAAPEAKQAIIELGAGLIDLKQSALDAAKATAEAAAAAEKSRNAQALGLQRQLVDLTKDPAGIAALREMEVAQLDGPLNQALQRYIYTLQDQKEAAEAAAKANQTATDNAYSAVERAVAAQRKTLETQRQAAESLVQEVSSIFDTLKSNVRDLFNQVDSTQRFQAAQGRAFISSALAGARAGAGLPDGTDLADAIAAARGGLDAQVFASQADADFQRLVLANELRDLQDLSGDQLTEAERQLKVSEDQLTTLDATLEAAKAQIDALRGIDTSVISVEQAIANLAAAVLAERSAVKAAAATNTAAAQVAAAATTAVSSAVNGPLLTAGGGFAPTAGMQAAVPGIADWVSPGDTSDKMLAYATVLGYYGSNVSDSLKKLAWEAAGLTGLPSFAVGTNVVPHDMLAQVHAGEMIVPAAYNPATSGISNARLERLVEGLTAEVQRLQAIVNDGNQHQRRTADTLENVTEGGANMRTVAL